MSRFWLFGFIALCMSAAAPAQPQPDGAAPTIDRLVEHVAAGHDLRQSEFRSVVSADGAERLLRAAGCEAGPPRYNQDRSTAMILWDCAGRDGRSGAGAMIDLEQERVTRIEVMSAVIVPVRSR